MGYQLQTGKPRASLLSFGVDIVNRKEMFGFIFSNDPDLTFPDMSNDKPSLGHDAGIRGTSVGPVLNTRTKSVTDLAPVGGHLLGFLLDGVRDGGLLDCRPVGNVAAECVAHCRCAVREDLGVVCAP